jgi:hypothetical protein
MQDGDRPDRGLALDKTGKRRTNTRGTADEDGRSGYGSESVRPYLRAQLRLKELLVTPDYSLDRRKNPR